MVQKLFRKGGRVRLSSTCCPVSGRGSCYVIEEKYTHNSGHAIDVAVQLHQSRRNSCSVQRSPEMPPCHAMRWGISKQQMTTERNTTGQTSRLRSQIDRYRYEYATQEIAPCCAFGHRCHRPALNVRRRAKQYNCTANATRATPPTQPSHQRVYPGHHHPLSNTLLHLLRLLMHSVRVLCCSWLNAACPYSAIACWLDPCSISHAKATASLAKTRGRKR